VPKKSDDVHERLAKVESSAITYQWLFTSLGVFTAIVLAVAGFFYKDLIPNQISEGITNSTSLKERFTDVHEQLTSLSGKLDKLQLTVSSTLHPKIIAAAIKDATSGDKASLTKTLPTARNLLTVAREMKVPLREKDYKDISKPLFSYYVSAKEPLKQELWATFIELANTRTSTDAILYPLSEEEIAKARPDNYFEGAEIDLSTKI